MKGRYIEIPCAGGATFRGYLATPANGKGPGIVLCHEIFGSTGRCAKRRTTTPKKDIPSLLPICFLSGWQACLSRCVPPAEVERGRAST